VEGIVRGRA